MCGQLWRIEEALVKQVMRRVPCGDVCPAPPTLPLPLPNNRTSENKELLRQQLLSASKERQQEKSEPPKQKLARNRQKNRWKLKFHHQALPQEYLDHYEQSLQRASAKRLQPKPKPPDKQAAEPTFDVNNFTNETFKIWAQRLAGIPSDTVSATSPPAAPATPAATAPPARAPGKADDRRRRSPAIAPSKIVTYDDLPYMGEMTLNNSKPRRGRKPKKADICHLIYENYGTVVPGRPAPARDGPSGPPRSPADPPAGSPRTDLQNRIISSLLERKLAQTSARRGGGGAPARLPRPDAPMPAAPPTLAGPLHSDDEPLNLCVRDLRDLKIQIRRKFGDIYSPPADVKPELEAEQPNAISVIRRTAHPSRTARSSPDTSRRPRAPSPALSEPARPPLACWPDAPVLLHPLALQTQLLYYRRLAALAPDEAGPLTPPTPPTPATPASLADTVSTGASSPLDDGKNKLVLKRISELLDPRVIERAEEAPRSPERRPRRASPGPARAPAKRKRSAIFIPPIPTRGGPSTPTTEVSICKFKFTGGSKPSLQEKKMLSVDSGGNFRYYSGTGAKGGRGYDYLRRGPSPRAGGLEAGEPPARPAEPRPATTTEDDVGRRKRKSRKSLQREKLERTFKEKGFLIQTQQLQSAEGATYCKFRQLRKFTRYLFRSWKDYLPGELEERPGGDPATEPSPPADGGTPAPAEWG